MFRKIHSNRDPKDTLASPNSVRPFLPYIEKTSVVDDATNEKPPEAIYRTHAHQYGYFGRNIIYHFP
jgi:hypothetical protein